MFPSILSLGVGFLLRCFPLLAWLLQFWGIVTPPRLCSIHIITPPVFYSCLLWTDSRPSATVLFLTHSRLMITVLGTWSGLIQAPDVSSCVFVVPNSGARNSESGLGRSYCLSCAYFVIPALGFGSDSFKRLCVYVLHNNCLTEMVLTLLHYYFLQTRSRFYGCLRIGIWSWLLILQCLLRLLQHHWLVKGNVILSWTSFYDSISNSAHFTVDLFKAMWFYL